MERIKQWHEQFNFKGMAKRIIALIMVLNMLLVMLPATEIGSVVNAAETALTAEEIAALGDAKITMTTSVNDIGSSIALSFEANDTVYVDLGDGSIIEYSAGSRIKGTDISVYCKGTMTLFDCSGNGAFTSLNASNCPELLTLKCGRNRIESLDLESNSALAYLDCSSNIINEIDVSNCPELQTLICNSNSLISELNLAENRSLIMLDCSSCKIAELDVSNCTQLESINFQSNSLRFSTLKLGSSAITSFVSKYQSNISISEIFVLDIESAVVDLSSEYNINGNITEYVWYADGNAVTPTTSSNGIFTFDASFAGKKLYCTMTNELFPDMSLRTGDVYIVASVPAFDAPLVTMSTALPVGSKLNLEFGGDGTDYMFIDWGDGNIVGYRADDVTKGSNISLYYEGDFTSFCCNSNKLTKLDVTNCPELTTLLCNDNELTELDVTNCTHLGEFHCHDNKLTELDVSNQTELLFLYCKNNNLTSLDISKCISLMDIFCSENMIAEIDVSNNTELISLVCSDNVFKFSTLYEGTVSNIESLIYEPQKAIELPEKINAYEQIADLSSEYSINGSLTVYVWYDSDGNVVIPTASANGIFTFDNSFAGKTLHCEMTNALFPELTLSTTNVTIESTIPTEPQITMTTELPVGSTMNLDITADDIIYIDWGDGNIVEWTKDGVTAGNNISIYCSVDIVRFSCSENNLTDLNVSNAQALTFLSCGSNKLTNIDLLNNVQLEELYCASNELSEIDVSNNTALKYLECNLNNLTAIDVSANTALVRLFCDNNSIDNIDISQNIALRELNCSFNSLTELDIANNLDLISVECNNNKLSELDLSCNTDLEAISCGNNQLTDLDTTNNTALYYLQVGENQLSALDLSKNTKLEILQCYKNQIEELKLPQDSKVTFMDLPENNLRFSTMPQYVNEIESAWYAPQADIKIDSSTSADESIDLSSEYNIDGTITVYTWYDVDDNTVTPTTAENGVFTFDNSFAGKTLHCEMTNALFPELILSTTEVAIEYAEVHATSIELDSANLTMPVGDEVTVNATVSPAGSVETVVWTSSDDTVAAVYENGNITAVGEGTATITATAGNVSASCTVTVTADGDIIIDDSTGDDVVVDAEPKDDFTCVDKDKHHKHKDDLKLVIGYVHDDDRKPVIDAVEKHDKHFDADRCDYEMYDICLVDKTNGEKVEVVDGKIKITLRIPDHFRHHNGYRFRLYHYKDNGTIEEIPIALINNNTCFYFYADDFSPFVLTSTEITADTTTPMYRLYNPNSGEHFYTGSMEERDMLVDAGWAYEGIAWNAPVASGEPVYRLFNPNSGDHHYTMSAEEREMLVGFGWQYEGVAWNSASPDNLPLYRMYNPNADCGSHHYTGSTEERDMLVDAGWIYEGIGWFGTLK